MEDGARRDVEFACGLFVWPVGTPRRGGRSKKGKGARFSSRSTYICRPAKMRRCCGGGTPDCSSTFSLIRVICGKGRMSEAALRNGDDVRHVLGLLSYLIIEIDVKLDLEKVLLYSAYSRRDVMW
jgi:hypothetical protein